MTYDYDQTVAGEQHLASAEQLQQHGFTIHEAPDANDAGSQDGTLDWLFDGGLDLETPEGCEAALNKIHREMEAENV